MAALKQFHDSSSWLTEDFFVQEHEVSQERKKQAEKTFELLKRKEKTLTQIALLKEKIRRDLENQDDNPIRWNDIVETFEPLKNDKDANYEMGLYYNKKWESGLWAEHWKKSLELSKKYEPQISDFFREKVLAPILDWYDYKEEITTIDFLKEFISMVEPIIAELKKETTDKNKRKILSGLSEILSK
ncbi:MAG: hypothetical protein ACD_2C00067G0005 [uncultured bacterium (gcode 4)]|uniref:Uncharacterized protein n=1 Tax=uncultured bacterium (gcode 4) TaxID=1234023 RepID=K2FFM5_9BACT|nr:MAG: hypothetical protein ACD_2C00067G0005 [uncultured bacterium (gcode 4)]